MAATSAQVAKMLECSGNCSSCGRCGHVFPERILQKTVFPAGFSIPENPGDSSCRIAVDIGTTTLAAALWKPGSDSPADVTGASNPQTVAGGDVVSRVAFAAGNSENTEILHRMIVRTVESMIDQLISRNGISPDMVSRCVLCGNSVMTLLMAGKSCDGMAEYPFYPETIPEIRIMLDIKDRKEPLEGILLPGISGHIGGDITAGILSCGISDENEISVLADLGTNGEVIMNIHGEMYGFSAAAGPAFEGAGISCGMPGRAGAITEFIFGTDRAEFRTIGDLPPAGICGSGLLSCISGLIDKGLIDREGNIADWNTYMRLRPYSSYGKMLRDDRIVLVGETDTNKEISITQEDIRRLQTAKAAVAGGFRVLMKETGTDAVNIDRFCISGGFGSNISPDLFIELGFIPQLSSQCILQDGGNSALSGASMAALSDNERIRASEISSRVKRIELSSSDSFTEAFINSFRFDVF